MLILYLRSRGFTEQTLAANCTDATLDARYSEFLRKTLVLTPNYLDVEPHVQKIAYNGVYGEFIDNIIAYVVANKIPNSLAIGYSDPTQTAWATRIANGFTSFAANTLKLELWHLLFEKIGKTEFLHLVLGTTCFQLAASGLYIQVFGKDLLKFFKTPLNTTSKSTFASSGALMPHTITNFAREVIHDDKITKKHKKLLQLGDMILKKHVKCNYSGIFNTVMDPTYLLETQEKVQPVDSHQVINYVMAVIGTVFSPAIWGNSTNKSIIRKCIVQYVLTGNKELYSIVVRTEKFSITSVSWLGGKHTTSVQDFENRKTLFTQFVDWFFNGFVRRLLCKRWHLITQLVTFGNPHMEYYPKKAWYEACNEWMAEYIDTFLYELSNVTDAVSANNKFVGAIKILPKTDGFRMLCIPLKSNPLIVDKDARELVINYARFMKRTVRPIQSLLNHRDRLRSQNMTRHHPRCTSASDVYEQLLRFRKLINGNAVFCLKFDMQKCYDNIDHTELVKCIDALFEPETDDTVFYVRQYSEKFIYSKKNEKRTFRVEKEDSILNYDLMNSEDPVHNPHHKSVIDKCITTKFTPREVKDFLETYMKESAIMISKSSVKLYKRKKGLFQGFPMLATLCNIFYNRIVDSELEFLLDEKPHSLFLRIADDFLFITTSKAQRQKVFDYVSSYRFHKYGGFVNLQKTLWADSSLGPFVFVGLTIDPKNLNITRSFNELPTSITDNCNSLPKLFTTLLWWFGSQIRNLISVELEPLELQVVYVQRTLETLIKCLIKASKRLEKSNKNVPEVEFKVFILTILERLLQRWSTLNGDDFNGLLMSVFESCFWKYRSNKLIAIACKTLQHI